MKIQPANEGKVNITLGIATRNQYTYTKTPLRHDWTGYVCFVFRIACLSSRPSIIIGNYEELSRNALVSENQSFIDWNMS